MADWVTISSLATAGGTLVLAVATFTAVRASNTSARIAQHALEAGVRPVLFPSRREDPPEEIMWVDEHWATLSGSGAVVEHRGDTVYLAVSLRNVGAGIAVLRGWRVGAPVVATPERSLAEVAELGKRQPDLDEFRDQSRDLYVPAGDTSFWQAAVRGWDDVFYGEVVRSVTEHHALYVDLLYGDHEGGQRTISRFSVTKGPDPSLRQWRAAVVRHWNIDRDDPR